jgi:uncharacterized protein (TIGR00297 family)
MQWFIGAILSLVFALIAWKKGKLSASGLVWAAVVGTSIFGSTGWPGFLVLAYFFISSNLIGKGTATEAKPEWQSSVEKGEARDGYQVLANGGAAAGAALFYALTGQSAWLVVMLASLAAANSDTWASELGRRSRDQPYDPFRKVYVGAGISGGITWLGTTGSVLGAASVALAGVPLLLQHAVTSIFIVCTVVFLSGWLGQWVDTWVGSKVQLLYQCGQCGQETEQANHCGVQAHRIKGWTMVDNDAVNSICTISASVVAYLLTVFLI